MYGYVLQDWITVRGASTISSIAQGENDWLGLAAFQDLVVWLDVRECTLGTATHIVMTYETAPIKDDVLFKGMATGINMDAVVGTVQTTSIILAQNPTVPLGRWVRWKITVSGTQSAAWDATFRILCCANAVGLAG